MRRTTTLLLASSLALTACGSVRESRINPFNWFGRSESVPVTQQQSTNPLIPARSGGLFARKREEETVYTGQPFEQITNLTIERVPGGAIVRATGLAARQGIYAVQLTPANESETPVDGTLIYRLEGVRDARATPVGTKQTREVTAARKVTDQQLRGVSRIRVEGQLNALISRR